MAIHVCAQVFVVGNLAPGQLGSWLKIMAPKRKRRQYAPPSVDDEVWSDRAKAEAQQERRDAGADLFQHLLSLYALCKLSAKDLCIACHYAALAGVPGGNFSGLALHPNQPSDGNYQRHLDGILPHGGPFYFVEAPCCVRGQAVRKPVSIPVVPPHEALAAEAKTNPDMIEQARSQSWPPCYNSHPAVVDAQRRGLPMPIPYCIYIDAVRYTAPLAGRTDSLLGIWLVNCTSERRHLLATLRTCDFCRCGCRGWCTIYPVLLAVAWGAEALLLGRRPAQGHDGKEIDPAEPFAEHAAAQGDDLGVTAVLLWIKGDWGEANHTLGFPSVTSSNNPCAYCVCSKVNMHEKLADIIVNSWPWPLRSHDAYESACAACEVQVLIANEADRAQLLHHVAYVEAKKGCGGRSLMRDVIIGGVRLETGDRVVPTATLCDVGNIEVASLPFSVTLWRARFGPGGRLMDSVVNRCPLFSNQLGTTPTRSLAIDMLHTFHYGPVMRWLGAALWRTILSNPWEFNGSANTILELGCKRLRADLFAWYVEDNVPADRQLGDFTLSMLGNACGCAPGQDICHPGCSMRTKAAETLDFVPWAIRALRTFGWKVPHRAQLMRAGAALVSWYEVVKTEDMCVSLAGQQKAIDEMQRHMLNSEAAAINFVPKHHFFCHATHRFGHQGNPRAYSTFLDESLNLVLRTCAQFAHRKNQATRIFSLFALRGAMGLSQYLFGAAEADEDD